MGGFYVLRTPDLRKEVFGFLFKSEEDFSKYVTKKVEKDAFKVTVEAKGTVDSSRNSSLTSNVEGQTTIISIVPAGTMVQEPLRAKFSAGPDVRATVKEIRNLSSRSPTIVIEEKTAKRNDRGELIDENGNPILNEEEKPVDDFERAAFETRLLELPYDMSVYSDVLVEVGDTVEYDEILIGDLVCELDASTLVDAEKQQQISVTQAEADLEKGIKNVEIQIAQNESDIASANLDIKLFDLDLKMYQEGTYIQEQEKTKGDIQQAEEELKLAQESLDFTQRVARKGYRSPDDVEVEKIKVLKAQLLLNVNNKSLEVLEDYAKERKIAELLEMAEESKRQLLRVKLAGEAALAQYQAEVKSRELSYNVQMQQLQRLREQIEACKLIAPQAGQVVYANENSRRSDPVVIEEGATVRERQKLINLPDMSAMKVDARIHESKISDVVSSLDVVIRVDAIPNHIYTGVLESVSSVPLPGNWPNLDLKQYEAVVKILDQGDILNQLKPGMTANIEIIVEESPEKQLQVPVQAAVDIGRGYNVWVLTEDGPERREVKLGRSNDVKFVVEKGLEAGEEVILNPRTHFSDEIAKLEAESVQKKQKERADSKDLDDTSAKADGPGKKSAPNQSGTTQQPAGGGPGGVDPSAIFARMDADGDGELAGAEISDRMKERISQIDTDGNGKLTKAEFIAGMPRGGGGNTRRPPQNGGQTRGAE